MKRWLLAIAVLLGASVGYASADYIVIVANLGEQREIRTDPNGGGIGAIGQVGQFGQFGQFGGMPGGMRGGGGFPGGMGGMRGGGIGQIGGMPGGMRGGGFPGGGQIGGGGALGLGGGGNFTGNPPTTPPKPGDIEIDPDAVPLYVVAILEIRNLPAQSVQLFNKLGKVEVEHHWGKSFLLAYADEERLHYRSDIIRRPDGTALPLLSDQYEKKHAALIKGTEKPDTGSVLDLAQWALEHGLLPKFTELMDGLAKDDPAEKCVAAYVTVKAALDAPLKDNGSTPEQDKLQEKYKLRRTARINDHYVVYHQSPTDSPIEVKSRLDRLEANFRSFYYWFAMKGISLPVPKERLTTVLASKEGDFTDLHSVLTSSPVVADGFFARRENLSIFSARRLDDGYDALVKLSDPLWAAGYNREELFKGVNKGVPFRTPLSKQIEAQAMALLLKAMESDGERASVSHDGTRQMVYAAGLLPRNVAAPEWIQFGMGSFFETPLGSPWTATGAPHVENLLNFKDYKKLKRLERTPGETLRMVVTDAYFRDAARSKDPARAALERKARAATWALTYFLMQTRPDGVLRYYKELSKQPRDVELDADTLLGCFARAFDLVDSGKNVDARKVDDLANQWDQFITRDTKFEFEDEVNRIRGFIASVTKETPKDKQPGDGTNPPTTPGGGPGRPGGPDGGPVKPPGGPGGPGGPGRPPGGGPGGPP